MLIEDTEELKGYLAGIQKNLSDGSIVPFIEQAELRYLVPVIGQPLYDHLDLLSEPSEKEEQLCKLLKRSLAYYTFLEAIPFLNVSVGNIGIQESNSEKSSPARQWSYVELMQATADNADIFLDKSLDFLETHAGDFPVWKESLAYTQSRELFINNARELSRHVLINNSRRVYLAMRVFLERAEELYIYPVLGADLWSEMKAYVLEPGTNPPAYQFILLEKIRKAVAQYAMYLCVAEIHFVLTPQGFKIQTRQGAAGNLNSSSLADEESIRQNALMLADRYLSDLRRYLDANAADIETYQSSPVYQSQTRRKHQLPDNSGKKSFRV